MPQPSQRVYIGIDPGATGAIAWIDNQGARFTLTPPTAVDMLECLETIIIKYPNGSFFATIEKVGGYIGRPQPGAAMFKFGVNYGMWVMVLTANKIPFEEVQSTVWQPKLSIPPKKVNETGSQHKNKLKAKAQQLFPGIKMTLANADALLIAEFCKRKKLGQL